MKILRLTSDLYITVHLTFIDDHKHKATPYLQNLQKQESFS